MIIIPEGIVFKESGPIPISYRYFSEMNKSMTTKILGYCIATSSVPRTGINDEFVKEAFDDIVEHGALSQTLQDKYKGIVEGLESINWHNYFSLELQTLVRNSPLSNYLLLDPATKLDMMSLSSCIANLNGKIGRDKEDKRRNIDFLINDIATVPYNTERYMSLEKATTCFEIHAIAYLRD